MIVTQALKGAGERKEKAPQLEISYFRSRANTIDCRDKGKEGF